MQPCLQTPMHSRQEERREAVPTPRQWGWTWGVLTHTVLGPGHLSQQCWCCKACAGTRAAAFCRIPVRPRHDSHSEAPRPQAWPGSKQSALAAALVWQEHRPFQHLFFVRGLTQRPLRASAMKMSTARKHQWTLLSQEICRAALTSQSQQETRAASATWQGLKNTHPLSPLFKMSTFTFRRANEYANWT